MSYTDAPDAHRRMGEFVDKCREHDILCDSFHLSSGYTSIADKRYVFTWNAEKFPDNPEEFIQDRTNSGQVAFGYGPHFCVGSPLARMEMRITLEVFVSRLNNLRLTNNDGPHFHPHSILRGLSKLNVQFDPA